MDPFYKCMGICIVLLILIGTLTKDRNLYSHLQHSRKYLENKYSNLIPTETPTKVMFEFPPNSLGNNIYKAIPYITNNEITDEILQDNLNNVTKSFTKLYSLISNYVFLNKSKTYPEIDSEMDFSSLNDLKNKTKWKEYLYGNHLPDKTRRFNIAIYKGLEYFFATCEKLNLTCFPVMGSLLGTWRHQSIIPWDYDADVIVGIKNNSVDNTRKLLMRALLDPPVYQISLLGQTWCRVFWTKLHNFEKTGGQIDIWFYKENATHIIGQHQYSNIKHPKKDVFPLHKRPFGTISLPCPRNTYACVRRTFPNIASKGDCGYKGKCFEHRKNMAFVFRVSFLHKLLEVVIKDKIVLNVAVTDEPANTDIEPFRLPMN